MVNERPLIPCGNPNFDRGRGQTLETKDGEIDYSKCSLSELLDVEAHIDERNFPENYANLKKAIAKCSKAEQPFVETRSIYASFWQRFGALLLDGLILLPLSAFVFWGSEQSRFFHAYYLVPSIIFGLWYHAYLVKQYGGTPGKLIVGIKIVKLDGEPVGYREALLRYSVWLVLATINEVTYAQTTMAMTDYEYFGLNWHERVARIEELAPSWLDSITLLTNIWVWGELLVMLTNKKRRAIHDFMAGTIVVRANSV